MLRIIVAALTALLFLPQIEAQARFRLCRGHPFQQPATGDVHTDEGPRDRITHQPGLVCQHRDRQPEL